MDSYDIQWKRSAEKDLLGIDQKQIPRLIKAIESLLAAVCQLYCFRFVH